MVLVIPTASVIISFGSKDTEKIWEGERVKRIPIEFQQVGRRKLKMLNNSQHVTDLHFPPSNNLEKLFEKLNDLYNIPINIQWRIIFKWENNHALEVERLDYH